MQISALPRKDKDMKKYVILADLTCDLSAELREYFGVKDYIEGIIHFSDGRDFNTTLEWDKIPREEFYKALSNKKMQISTAPASPEMYYEKFKSYAQQGIDILSMSISSKISSTYGVAQLAASRVKEEYPDCNIYCFDSYRMSGAFGLLLCYAQEMQNNGSTMDEVIDWLGSNKRRVHQMGPIDDLMFIARRGRISTGKAIMGTFAGVKPMGDCNSDGYVSVLGKVKGIKKAFEVTVEYMKLTATDPSEQYVIVSHSDREAYANMLKGMIEEQICPKKVFVSDVFCGCGTNIGPGMVGVYFLGDQLSEDGETEKANMMKAMERVK